MLVALIVLCIINIGILLGGIYAYRKADNMVSDSVGLLSEIFSSKGPDQPSYFQEAIEQITDSISQKIGVTTQAAIRGSLGGSAKAINHELEQEAIAGDPSLAMMEFLPKSLKKNPVAVLGLQRVLGKMLAGSGAGSGKKLTGSNGHAQAKFTL